MRTFRYLIVGGGIAGTTAAETLRKAEPEATIAIISDEPHPLYSRVLLSKPAFLTGKQPFDTVWMKTPEWYVEQHIEFLGGRSAIALDASAKVLTLDGGETLGYEKLLLATGVHPRLWTIPGAEKKGVHYLRSLDHAKGIIEDLKDGKKHAVMIGSACVTFEVAEILRSLDIEVTEVMRENYFWEPALSQPEAEIVERHLSDHGVKMLRNAEVAEVLGSGERVEGVLLKDGTKLACDMVFAFIGVVIPTEWLESSGIALEKGVVANEYLETSLPDVWAAGDIARFDDVILHDRVMMGNWMNAREQGHLAAENILGAHKQFKLVSFHTSHGFGNMVGFAGDNRAIPDRTYIFRGDPTADSYGRITLRGNVIVGATMINRTPELGTIVKLIAGQVDVSAKKSELADANFDLKTLVPVVQ